MQECAVLQTARGNHTAVVGLILVGDAGGMAGNSPGVHGDVVGLHCGSLRLRLDSVGLHQHERRGPRAVHAVDNTGGILDQQVDVVGAVGQVSHGDLDVLAALCGGRVQSGIQLGLVLPEISGEDRLVGADLVTEPVDLNATHGGVRPTAEGDVIQTVHVQQAAVLGQVLVASRVQGSVY